MTLDGNLDNIITIYKYETPEAAETDTNIIDKSGNAFLFTDEDNEYLTIRVDVEWTSYLIFIY